jgi:ABC-type Fe3+-hydroxamate transport system substrate-binding protein
VRIVSLIPEATEILQAIGLGDDIMALSPEDVDNPVRLTSALTAARPALIFTSETAAGGGVPRATVRRAASALRPRPSVYALEPHSLGEILSDIKTVGDATGHQSSARALIEALRVRIDIVTLRAARRLADPGHRPRRVACLQRTDPPVAAGGWLAELIGLAGGLDVLDGVGRPPRAVTWPEIEAARPDLIVRVDLTPPTGAASDAPTVWTGNVSGRGGACPTCLLPLSSQERMSAKPIFAPRSGSGGEVFPGPGAVDLLEQIAARL